MENASVSLSARWNLCKGLFHTISAGQPWKKFPWHAITMVWHSLVQSPLKLGWAIAVVWDCFEDLLLADYDLDRWCPDCLSNLMPYQKAWNYSVVKLQSSRLAILALLSILYQDCKSIKAINLKLTQGTVAELEFFREVAASHKFWSPEAPKKTTKGCQVWYFLLSPLH